MQKRIGIFVTHNILNSYRNALSESQQILSKTLLNPKIKSTKIVDFHYQLLSIPNSERSSIETRSKKISDKLEYIVSTKKLDGFHLISNGLSGLDSRYLLLNNPNLNRICQTLITVNTPNQGSTLADLYLSDQINRFLLDRISISTGLSPESFTECNTANMRDFNDYMDDHFDDRIFTFGASKDYTNHTTLFKEINKILLKDLGSEDIDTDGILFTKETILNNDRNLGFLNADFFDMSCFALDNQNSGIYGVSIDFCKQRIV